MSIISVRRKKIRKKRMEEKIKGKRKKNIKEGRGR